MWGRVRARAGIGALMVSSVLGFVGAAPAAASTAPHGSGAHDVALSCPGGDLRTAADKLPRPGVIVTGTSPPFGVPLWTAYRLTTAGTLSMVAQSNGFKLVALWQNGTDCQGDDSSRNFWLTDSLGRVSTQSGWGGPPANFYGDMSGQHLNQPVVGMSPTGDGLGYWLVASDGGIFSFGDAQFYGSTGNIHLNQPIVAMATTPDGGGYWLVASDGGVFSFGDAQFYGSMGNVRLNKPIEGLVATPDGRGYWMVASDGGIFTFGDASFLGSLGSQTLSAPIAGMISNGIGYTLIGQDGKLYPFT